MTFLYRKSTVMNLKAKVNTQLKSLKKDLSAKEIVKGIQLYNEEKCTLLSQSGTKFDFVVEDGSDEGKDCCVEVTGGALQYAADGKNAAWDGTAYACLLAIKQELESLDPKAHEEHKKIHQSRNDQPGAGRAAAKSRQSGIHNSMG
jgi:hypothetical protein